MNYLDEYKKWCEGSEFDEETKAELRAIANNENEMPPFGGIFRVENR